MGVEAWKGKNISGWVDLDNLTYVRWNCIKTVHKDTEGDWKKKKK